MEKRNNLEVGQTRCCLCGRMAVVVVGNKALCDQHSQTKEAQESAPTLRNASDHLESDHGT